MSTNLNRLAEAVELEDYRLTAFTGEVLSETILSSMDLNVSGGGGSISMADGYGGGEIDPISVSSSTTHKQKLFLKNKAGVEKVFLNDPDVFDVRQGHIITIVQAHPKINKPDIYNTHLINHNTGQRVTHDEVFQNIMDGYRWGFFLGLAFIGCVVLAFINPLNLSLLIRGIFLLGVGFALIWKYSNLCEAQRKAFFENPSWQRFDKALLSYPP